MYSYEDCAPVGTGWTLEIWVQGALLGTATATNTSTNTDVSGQAGGDGSGFPTTYDVYEFQFPT